MIRQRSAFMFWQVLVVTGCRLRRRGEGGSGLAEERRERGDGFVQQGGDACLLAGRAAGAESGDRAAVLGFAGELADPGGYGRVGGGRAARAGAASRG
jgi:hypothetical protein